MTLVKQCANFSVVGAVPFATFAQTFNRRFGYDVSREKGNKGTPSGPAIKRMKRWVNISITYSILHLDIFPVAVAEAGSSLLIVSILNERILRQDRD